MRDPNDKTAARPADIRSISDPPDMGRLRPAEEVAKEMVDRYHEPMADREYGVLILDQWADTDLPLDESSTAERQGRVAQKAESFLANLIRQSRAEGAAAALEAAAVHFVGVRRDPEGSAILRARAKAISDPPDMG